VSAGTNKELVRRLGVEPWEGNLGVIDEQLAEGDLVASRWTGRGTHQGELMGIPPTGKQVTVSGITISRVKNGKVVEEWSNWDTLGMLQQLGVVPEMAGTRA